MLTCGECGNLCGDGHDFCFKCGKLLLATQKIPSENANLEQIAEVLGKLGWETEVKDAAIAASAPGFYRWYSYVISRDSLIFCRSQWSLQNGIPDSQILESVNMMNAKAWQTAAYLFEYDDGDRSLCVTSATPVSSTFSVYALDRLVRAADEEATQLISISGIAELLS